MNASVSLEAIIAVPLRDQDGEAKSDLAFILTHPYGPLGGDMHNNVVSGRHGFSVN